MTICQKTFALVAGLLLVAGSLHAQDSAADAAARARARADAEQNAKDVKERAARDAREYIESFIPLQVQIVISKYQGEKKVSSSPYVIAVNANDNAGGKLRMNARVPVPMAAPPVVDNKPIPYSGPMAYQDVGTSIDCKAKGPILDRFTLELSIDDSSVAPVDPSGIPPSIRSFKLSNTALLKDGQSTQFTTATDKITGETTKIDVTLKVMK